MSSYNALILLALEKIFHSNQMEFFPHATYVSDSKIMLLCVVRTEGEGTHMSVL